MYRINKMPGLLKYSTMFKKKKSKILIAILFVSSLLGWATNSFLITLILLSFFFVFGILWLLNKKLVRITSSLFTIYPTRSNNYRNFERNFDFVNVGGTEALYAIDYNLCKDIKGLNWANEHQTLEYDLLILKNFYGILKKNGNVLIFLTPSTFLGNRKSLPIEYHYQIF